MSDREPDGKGHLLAAPVVCSGIGTTFSGCAFENVTFCAISTECWSRRWPYTFMAKARLVLAFSFGDRLEAL